MHAVVVGSGHCKNFCGDDPTIMLTFHICMAGTRGAYKVPGTFCEQINEYYVQEIDVDEECERCLCNCNAIIPRVVLLQPISTLL